MIRYLLPAIILAITSSAYSVQPESDRGRESEIFSSRLSGEIVSLSMRARGSQYTHQDWKYGEVVLYSGELVSDVSLRYNGYRNMLVWRDPKTLNHIRLDNQLIEGFSLQLDTGTINFRRLQVSPGDQSIFAECLFEDEIKLFAWRNIEQTGDYIESTGARMVSIPILEPRPRYYLKDSRGNITRIRRLNQRSLTEAFPEEQREKVRELADQHNLRINDEATMIRAVRKINDGLSELE